MSLAVTRAKSYLKTRHQAVRKAMKSLKLDGILLTTAPDLGYLSGFTGDDSIGIITEKEIHLVTDFRYKEQAEMEAALAQDAHARWEDVRCAGKGTP